VSAVEAAGQDSAGRDSLRSRFVPRWFAELGRGGHRGALAWQSLLTAVGMFLPISVLALYLIGPANLSKRTAALCLTVGAVATILATVPVGRLIRIVGARRYAVGSNLVRAAAFAAFPLSRNLSWIVLVLAVVGVAETASTASFQIIIADALGEQARAEGIAIRRTIANVGFTLAAGLTSLVVGIGRTAAYDLAFFASSAAFLGSALLTSRLPGNRRPTDPAGRVSAWVAIRDGRYMSLVGVSSVFSTSNSLLTVALPLWVVTRTTAPRWSVGVLLAINTVLVVLLQVRVARTSGELPGARRAVLATGVLFAVASIGYGVSAYGPVPVVLAVLVLATVVAALAEMSNSGAWWTISYLMAPPAHREEYLAAFDISVPAVNLLAPSVMVGVVGLGLLGWFGYAAIMVVGTLVALPLLRHVD